MSEVWSGLHAQKFQLIRIKVGELAKVDELSPQELGFFLAQIPALKDPSVLSQEALLGLAMLQPPIVWQMKKRERRYAVLGNVRTVEICRAGLGKEQTIHAIKITSLPKPYCRPTALKVFGLLSAISFGLDASYAKNSIHKMVKSLAAKTLEEIAPGLETKSGRERLLGFNRRFQLPERELFRAPTSQMTLEVNDDA